jgi:hypothetical protein
MSGAPDWDAVQGPDIASGRTDDWETIDAPIKATKWVPDQAPVRLAEKPVKEGWRGNPKEDLYGGLEAAASVLTGIASAPVAAVAGLYRGLTGGKYGTAAGALEAQARAAEVSRALTYQPRSQSGQSALGEFGKAFEASKLAGLGPTEAMGLAGVSASARPRVAPPVAPVSGQMGSVGAAGTVPLEQARAMVASASPELKAAVEKVGNKIDLQVLARHAEADTLPVPVRLTTGQATQDVARLSNEQNLRGKHPELANRFNEQNKALIENTAAIREAAAPDVYVTSKPEVGQHVIDAYQAKDAAANARISGLYKALENANGGQFPVDAQALRNSADTALHKQLLYEHLPPEFRRTLDRLGNTMSFEQYEALRTNLAREMRDGKGNGPAAAGVVRQAMEDLPLLPEAAGLKQLAGAARAAARERFAAIEADPAYKAVTRGKASADDFINKYVVGADLKDVQTMKVNLAHDPTAQQALSAGVIDRLTESGVKSGNFTQAGYNRMLDAVRPKLGVLFGSEQRGHLEQLGRVAGYTQAQPRGSFVNVSNTLTGAIAEHAKTAAKGAVEGAANVAAKGVPVGTWARRIGGRYMEGRTIRDMLEAGGGIKQKEAK